MNRKKNWVRTVAIWMALTICIGLSACQSPAEPENETDSAAGEILENGEVNQNEAEPEGAYTLVSKYMVPYSIEDLTEQSTLVIYGSVTGISESFTIKGVGEVGEMVFTDYYISPINILRGEIGENSSITVRQEGDPRDTSVIYEDDPVLLEGKEYLLFLQKPGIGGGFNTQGDYYCILGLKQGIYEKQMDQNLAKAFSLETDGADIFLSQAVLAEKPAEQSGGKGGQAPDISDIITPDAFRQKNQVTEGMLELHALERQLEQMEGTYPVDENYRREELEANFKNNLDNGFLTQEEYDEAMAELDIFAEIVK